MTNFAFFVTLIKFADSIASRKPYRQLPHPRYSVCMYCENVQLQSSPTLPLLQYLRCKFACKLCVAQCGYCYLPYGKTLCPKATMWDWGYRHQ